MNRLKKMIANRFKDFAFYYHYLEYRVFISLFLSIIVGVLDGFGLTMFLPLLQKISGSENINQEALGNLGELLLKLEDLGVRFTLLSVLLTMVFFFSLKGIFVYISGLYDVGLTQIFIKKIRKEQLRSLGQIRYKYFVLSDVGRIQNSMTGEVDRVTRSFRDYFRTIQHGILVAVYTGFAFILDAQFALLVVCGGAFSNILYRVVYKKTKKKSLSFTQDSHVYQGLIVQFVAHFKYLRATALVGRFSKHLEQSIDEIELHRRKMGGYAAILRAAREPVSIIIVSAVIMIEIYFLGGVIGGILLSLVFFYRALNALIQMQTSWNRYMEVSGSVENIKLFKKELRENHESNGHQKYSGFSQSISLENVNFEYDEKEILSGINLNIYKNESLALVGESGSGKTTLANLIAGLMPAENGNIKLDDLDFQELNLKSYQKRIGYITQDPVIFSDTVYNNVTCWDDFTEANYERFKNALTKAFIFDFIDNLPDKHMALLGNNGINLSGGQKQRISIARELYKDIDLLIMDEATSALDSETERIIQQNIEGLKGEYTILIVAHRLSTIKNVDRIVLMKNGKIDSIGTYSELVLNNKEFEHMVKLQEL